MITKIVSTIINMILGRMDLHASVVTPYTVKLLRSVKLISNSMLALEHSLSTQLHPAFISTH